jgi:hypothetical protein
MLGKGINGGGGGRLCLRGGKRRQELPLGVMNFPYSSLQWGERPLYPVGYRTIGRTVKSLPIEAHARSDDELFNRVFEEGFKQDGSAEVIWARIVSNFIHTLANTDGRREVIYYVDPLKRAPDHHWIADIPNDQLNLRVEIMRSLPFRPMNLRGQ